MNQQIPKHKIIEILNLLNIKYKDVGKSWIKCQCPFPGHVDKHPSAGININTGVFNCFSCTESKHIITVIMDDLNCDYNTAKNMVFEDIENTCLPPVSNITKPIFNKPEKKEIKISKRNFASFNMDLMKFKYTELRGFNKEFCDAFNIELALSGWYKDYIIIPIEGNDVNSFEARKVMDYEYLLKYFEVDTGDYDSLKKRYKQLVINKDIIENEYSYYLNKPKTLYPKDSNINNTIFNFDNLDYDKPLYLTEGTGSLPKIYTNVTHNVSCTFGVQVSDTQIRLLRNFKKVILIPDNDLAGKKWVIYLNKYLKNLHVKGIKSEDTDDSYVEDIVNTKEVLASKFLLGSFFKED